MPTYPQRHIKLLGGESPLPSEQPPDFSHQHQPSLHKKHREVNQEPEQLAILSIQNRKTSSRSSFPITTFFPTPRLLDNRRDHWPSGSQFCTRHNRSDGHPVEINKEPSEPIRKTYWLQHVLDALHHRWNSGGEVCRQTSVVPVDHSTNSSGGSACEEYRANSEVLPLSEYPEAHTPYS